MILLLHKPHCVINVNTDIEINGLRRRVGVVNSWAYQPANKCHLPKATSQHKATVVKIRANNGAKGSSQELSLNCCRSETYKCRPDCGIPWNEQGRETVLGSIYNFYRENGSTRRKPISKSFCPPQIPHDLNGDRTRVAPVGSRQLIS